METVPRFDVVVRSGFRHAHDVLRSWIASEMGPCNIIRHRIGASFAPIAERILRGRAPYIVFIDDIAATSDRVLRRVFQFTLSNPACAGTTLGAETLSRLFGDSHARERLAQSVAAIPALPPWFAIVRRSALEAAAPDADWETPEFFLFDFSRRAAPALFRVGGPEDLSLDVTYWARDILAGGAGALARDYARFRGRHSGAVAIVPPQFRVDQIGEIADVPELPPRAIARNAFPRFTVISPVFKPEFLVPMIDSVRAQTWQNWELQLLVDGPPEESRRKIEQILQRYADEPRIRYRFQENRGTGPTRNELASSAEGDFVLSIDDDDELTPDALAVFASAILDNPGVPFFRGGARLIGLVNRELRPRPRFVISGISNDTFEVTQPFVIAREALAALGGFQWDADLRNAGEDTYFFQKADRVRLETRIVDRVLYHRRLSTQNLTLEFKPEEAIAHGVNLDMLFRPRDWEYLGCVDDMIDGFQRSTSVYRGPDGREVVCSTRFFQYRTLGTIDETTIDLELTSVCNAVCTFCPREFMPDKTRFIPVPVIERLALQLQSMQRPPHVVFCGIGESTLHPHLETITKLIASAGSRVTMTTNGARMTPELFRRLVAAGMSAFNFSLNAATAETHQAVMKLTSYDRVVSNLLQILAVQRAEYPDVAVNVSFVVCNQNEHEVDHFVAQWLPRVTMVWLHPLNNRAGMLAEGLKPVDLLPYALKFQPQRRVIVDVLRDCPEDEEICKVARSFIFISAEGDMRLCAMDYGRVTNYGNVATTGLQSAHYKKLLGFLAGETRDLCESCDFCPRSFRARSSDALQDIALVASEDIAEVLGT